MTIVVYFRAKEKEQKLNVQKIFLHNFPVIFYRFPDCVAGLIHFVDQQLTAGCS